MYVALQGEKTGLPSPSSTNDGKNRGLATLAVVTPNTQNLLSIRLFV